MVLPVILLILLVAADFGRLFYADIQVHNAAREAANYGAFHAADTPFDSTAFLSGITSAATNEKNVQRQVGAGTMAVDDIRCFDPIASVAPSAKPDAIDCAAAAQFASGIGRQVAVDVSQPFTFLTPFVSNFFGGSIMLRASATAPVLNPPAPLPTPAPTPVPGTLVITKNIAGDLTAFTGGDFVFDVVCGVAPYGPVTLTFASGQATKSSSAITIPAGRSCTITETSVAHPDSHAGWGTTPSPVVLTISSSSQSTATFTNTRTYNPPGPSTGPTPTPSPTPVVTPSPTPCTNPTVTLSPSGTTGAKGESSKTVTFAGTSSGTPVSWRWDFGDGTQATSAQTATHTFVYTKGNGLQSWTITLTVQIAGGCSGSRTASVTLNP